jgi:hypothetical protein
MEGEAQEGFQQVMEQGHAVLSAWPSQTEVVQRSLSHLAHVSAEKGPLPFASPPQLLSQDAQRVGRRCGRMKNSSRNYW